MKFISIPDPRKAGMTKESLVELKHLGVIPSNIGAFASVAHFAEAGGMGMPSEGTTAKYWRDNSTIWQPDRSEFLYVMLERNPDGSFVRMPLNFSDPSFEIYSSGTANFYRQYATHFPFIPRLVAKAMPRYEAGRFNLAATGVAEDYPVGIYLNDPTGSNGLRPTFPSNIALRFNPQTGTPEAFLWADYIREYPFDWTPAAPPAPGMPGRLSDDELVNAASGVIASPMAIKEKAAAIRYLGSR
jgi:hypothetical protein